MPSATPGVAAAVSLAVSDVFVKVVLASGCDVLTMLTIRSFFGLALVAAWLRIKPPPAADARIRWISFSIGIILACLMYLLFKAIEVTDVPTAIVTYFVYPLFTGLAAGLVGLEAFRWRGILCAIIALFGLAVMIGAHPAGFVSLGVMCALGAAVCRTAVLLVTRRFLIGGDARVTTWYSGVATLLVFVAAALAAWSWNMPETNYGWLALLVMSVASMASIVLIFLSTVQIGPFRTALLMQLEPLIGIVLSAVLLGQVITPTQALGSAIMLAGLAAFQLTR
jgi:drug/metabolite transporter (DMT)-like permease